MFKFKTIKNKTIVLIFSLFVLFLGLDMIYQFYKIQTNSFEILDKTNTTLNKLMVENASAYVYDMDIENLQKTVDSVDSEYVKAVFILDLDGRVIVQSNSIAHSNKYMKFDELVKLKKHSIKNSDEYMILNTFKILDVPIGYMLLEANLEKYKSHIREEIQMVVIIAFIWLIIFLIIASLIANSLTLPIYEIVNKLRLTKDEDVLKFPNQAQEEFEFLSQNIANTHNRLRLSNEYLELKVKEKTSELQDLNASLKERVKEEVEKNRLQNQQMLQQSRLAQMGEMISMIAHQWRQPLGAISTTTANIEIKFELEMFDLDSRDGVNEAKEYIMERLQNINGYVSTLTKTIDDFRNFYKPNKESVESSLEDVVLNALNIIRASLRDSNIELIEDYDSNEKFDMYDSELMQVMLNILKNAQDNFVEKKTQNPQIVIRTFKKSISVRDNGGGISQDILERIFDPYFSTKNEKNGSGLGLYMSKIIVQEHHKGKLSAVNTQDGVCFSINLSKEDE